MSRARRVVQFVSLAAVLTLLLVGLAAFVNVPTASAGGGIDDYGYRCSVVSSQLSSVTVQVRAIAYYLVGNQMRTRMFYSARFAVPVTKDFWERDGRLLGEQGSGSVRMKVYWQGRMVSRAVTCMVWRDAGTGWAWRAQGVNVTTSW